MRLRDFDLVTPTSVSGNRDQNWGSYPLNEGTRLQLATEAIEAPFTKIAASMRLDISQPTLLVAEAVCVVELPAVCYPVPTDAQYYAQRSLEVLDVVDKHLRWRNSRLRERYEEIQRGAPPCVHEFGRLTKVDRTTKQVCSTHFQATYRSSVVSTRFSKDGVERHSATVVSRAEPLWFTPDFPLDDAVIRDGHYCIRDRGRRVLASIPVPPL